MTAADGAADGVLAPDEDVLVLEVRFLWRGQFRVGTGHAAEAVDDALDPDNTLSETSVKNRLKAAARQVGIPEPLVRRVFEGGAGGSCWNLLVEQPQVMVAPVSKIRIDPQTRTVVPTGLTTRHDATAVGAARLRFSRLRPLPDTELRQHLLVLLVAARACKGVGGSRNRGLGSWDLRLSSCAVAGVHETGLLGQLREAGIDAPAIAAASGARRVVAR